MQCRRVISEVLVLIIILAGSLWLTQFFVFARAASTSNSLTVTGTVLGCGDGIIQTGEECDGSELNSQSCSSQGFDSGTLACSSDCTFDTSQCASASPPSGGGGGGGGGGFLAPIETAVVFSGKAYPLSKVTVLKDGQKAITTVAGPDANFKVSLTGLSAGSYFFSVYGEDNQGRRSAPFTFSVDITRGSTAYISGIFISPTIDVNKKEVKQGSNVIIFGQSAPNSEITIAVSSDEEFFAKMPTDKDGVYLYNFDSTPLAMGQHFARSKDTYGGEVSPFSKSIGFMVGTRNVAAAPSINCPAKADLNDDCRVNLVDFSIAAYWYRRPISAAFALKEAAHMNGDGKIDLVDFSIMAFYWTG